MKIKAYYLRDSRLPYMLRIITIDDNAQFAQFMWLRGYMYYEQYPLEQVPRNIRQTFTLVNDAILRGEQELQPVYVPFAQAQELLPEWLHPYFVHFIMREPPESKW